jgi:hypothetical protein
MPVIGINVMLTGNTTQVVKNENGYSVLEFDIDEYLGELEPKNFWLEVKHKTNNRYLMNKTNSINQNSRSTTAILVGVINYIPPITDPITNSETSPSKFILNLEDISLITHQTTNNNNQTLNAPWLNTRRTNRVARGASPRNIRRSTNTSPNQPSTLVTVSNINTSPDLNLETALSTNPPPSGMNNSQPEQQQND